MTRAHTGVCQKCGKKIYPDSDDPVNLCDEHLKEKTKGIIDEIDSLLSDSRQKSVKDKKS